MLTLFLYSFPTAAITNYQECSGLKENKFASFQFWPSELLKSRGKQESKKYFVSLPFPAFEGLSYSLTCGPCLHLLNQRHSIFFLSFILLFSPRNLTYRTKYQMKNSHPNKNKDQNLKSKNAPSTSPPCLKYFFCYLISCLYM